jgi:pyruvate ferredoxin oxidoreductase gamma subunit
VQEIIWHGRGGQGVVAASSIMGTALALYEGNYALSIPRFGGERRGAPLIAITRFAKAPLRRRDLQADPDYIVIFDDTLVSLAVKDLNHEKPRHIIVNSRRKAAELGLDTWQNCTIVDAETIALELLNRPIVNTVMVGVFAAATGLAQIDSVKKAVAEVLPPELVTKNIAAAEKGFQAALAAKRKG